MCRSDMFLVSFGNNRKNDRDGYIVYGRGGCSEKKVGFGFKNRLIFYFYYLKGSSSSRSGRRDAGIWSRNWPMS